MTNLEMLLIKTENRLRDLLKPGSSLSGNRDVKNIHIPEKQNWIELELKTPEIQKKHPQLFAVACEINSPKDYNNPALYDLAMEKTRSYHQMLWNSCSMDEKLVLNRLATDRFVSVQNLPTVELLFRRGLIKRNVNIKPFNTFFGKFILETKLPEEEFWIEQESKSGWDLLRLPIMLVLVGIIIFLYATQNQVLGIITGASALLPVLLRFLGIFQPQKNLIKESE